MLNLSRRAGALAVGFVFAASAAMLAATSAPVPAATPTDATGSTSRPALLPRADPSSPATIVTPDQDVPDPFVLVEGRAYYMYATAELGLDAPQISLRTSTDNPSGASR